MPVGIFIVPRGPVVCIPEFYCRYLCIVDGFQRDLFCFGNDLYCGAVHAASQVFLQEGIYAIQCSFFVAARDDEAQTVGLDRKSTRLNSSHVKISYAVFRLKKKTKHTN